MYSSVDYVCPDRVELSEEQKQAVLDIQKWYYKRLIRGYYRMGGCAGTGKSYVIPEIIYSLGLNYNSTAVVAYTGKAAMVLRRKHIPATTIHRLIYKPIEVINPQTGEIEIKFIRVKKMDSDLKLIIVDESSMVNKQLHDDLMSYHIPILYIGDYYQLPPVNGDFNLMDERNLDFKLTKIHRQAEGSDIIKISMKIRNGENIDFGDYGAVIKISDKFIDKSELLNYSQVICGYNSTRTTLNNMIREMNGYTGLPKRCEKLIVLQNNYTVGVVNGQQLILNRDSSFNFKTKSILECSAYDEYDTRNAIDSLNADSIVYQVNSEPFHAHKKSKFKIKNQDLISADYGYSITTHKAQGSEWDTVMLYDDGFGRGKGEYRRRWLYTAITRATDKLTWVVS